MDVLAPEEYILRMEDMCDDAKECDFKYVRKVIEEDFGVPLEELFEKFNPKPLSSASIAQVHRAVLKETGEEVAVKIMHPDIMDSIPGDLRIVSAFINLGEWLFPSF